MTTPEEMAAKLELRARGYEDAAQADEQAVGAGEFTRELRADAQELRDAAALLLTFSARVKEMELALEPFAKCADELDATADTPRAPDGEWAKFRLLTDDYRRARRALGRA